MGVIQRQGTWNTILSYIGVGIGTLNLIFLYPIFFQTDEIGLIRTLTSLALLFSHVSSLGIGGILLRFFPHFRTSDRRHSGFPSAAWLYAGIGFLLALLLYLSIRPSILGYYEPSSLLRDYDLYVIPLALFVLIYNLVELFDRAHFQTMFTLLGREVLLRLFTTAGILAVGWGYWNFEAFMLWFLGIHALIALIALSKSIYAGRIGWNFNPDFFKPRRLRVLFRYGMFTFMTGASTFAVQTIDSIMLGAYVNLEAVGIYTIAFFMGSVIAIPFRGISRIAIPVVSQAWKESDLVKINRVYAATSYLQFLAGAVILSLITLSLRDLFTFLPEIYSTGFIVVFLIGLGHLIDMTGGLNANILATSPKYHVDLYVNLCFILACILLNILLIPAYGLNGAAMASLISYLLLNTARCLILYRLFGFNPFQKRFLAAGVLVSVAGLLTWQLPLDGLAPLLAIFTRSVVFVAILAALGYATGIHKHIQSEIRL